MEQGVVKLVNGLNDSRVQSAIVTFNAPDELARTIRDGVPLFQFQKRDGNDPRLVLQLARLFRRTRPHVVHTHSWGTLLEGLVAAFMARVPFVVHGEHGTMEVGALNLRLQRWAWKRVDRVLAVSSRLADRMAAVVGFPRDRISIIRNGTSLQRFGSVSRAAARAEAGWQDGELVVGTVGRLVAVKDQVSLLEAIAHLRGLGRNVRVVLVGDGPLRPQLEARVAALRLESVVQMPGVRLDVERVLAGMDVFVLPSISEGLSNTIIEAMASGLPVVATRVGGSDELVDDGVTGVLVPPRNPAALARAIDRVLLDKECREGMALAGRRKAEAEFSLERMLGDYERLYLELAGQQAHPGSLRIADSPVKEPSTHSEGHREPPTGAGRTMTCVV